MSAAVARAVPAGWSAVNGWQVNAEGDYAQPATVGGGYCEMSDAGLLEVAVETDDSAQSMGLDAYLKTKVPAAVLRALLDAFDAKGDPKASATTRVEQLDQLTMSVEHISKALTRVIPTDTEAFAEIAHALESMARDTRHLAHGDGR